ncbi:MAG: SAM-dependent methyltransferase [Chitinophagaceae bacterium]
MPSKIYLIPSLLSEDAVETIPSSVIKAVKQCQVFFVEDERTARRFLKKLWKEIMIDHYEWFEIGKAEENLLVQFKQKIKEEKIIGIISEAGCPGIADPGQKLIAAAQKLQAHIQPLVGPSSILLALMASGMNGQQFQFDGYLPINNAARTKRLKELEAESKKKNCTQIFIETPYRNNQLVEAIIKICQPSTQLCIAASLTAENEIVKTKTIAEWKAAKPELHKQPVIFLLYAGS